MRGRHTLLSSCTWSPVVSCSAPSGAGRQGACSHRGTDEECLWPSEKLYTELPVIHIHDVCIFPQDSLSWSLLSSLTRPEKGTSLLPGQLPYLNLKSLPQSSVCNKSLVFCSQNQVNDFSRSSTSNPFVADMAHGKFHPDIFRLGNFTLERGTSTGKC